MEKLLIFIKHHLSFIWNIIEKLNNFCFYLIFKKRMLDAGKKVFKQEPSSKYNYRLLNSNDAEALTSLISHQSKEDVRYFNPHGFDIESIRKQFSNHSFLMMGSFDGDKLIGYFFLRFFVNKKCFVGRLIDKDYRGKGIGVVMNNFMYKIAWTMNFRCLSTISKNNKAVMHAHSRNKSMVILKNLSNDYLLVEFKKQVNTEI